MNPPRSHVRGLHYFYNRKTGRVKIVAGVVIDGKPKQKSKSVRTWRYFIKEWAAMADHLAELRGLPAPLEEWKAPPINEEQFKNLYKY